MTPDERRAAPATTARPQRVPLDTRGRCSVGVFASSATALLGAARVDGMRRALLIGLGVIAGAFYNIRLTVRSKAHKLSHGRNKLAEGKGREHELV